MGNKKEHKIENDIEMKHCPTCDKWKAFSEYNKQSFLQNRLPYWISDIFTVRLKGCQR